MEAKKTDASLQDQECMDQSTEGPNVPPEDPKPPGDSSTLCDGERGDGQEVESPTNIHCDCPSEDKDADTQGGASVPLNEESGGQPTFHAEDNTDRNVQECMNQSTEGPNVPPEDTKPPGDSSTFCDGERGDGNEAESPTNMHCDGPSEDKDADTQDGASVPLNEESGGQPTFNAKNTIDRKEHKRRNIWIAVALVVVAVLLQQLLQPREPPQKTDLSQIDIFHQEMEKVKVQFPSQREELWKRSKIHLRRHFQITQPTEPISIILTAGVRAEGTLHCLAQRIASALSSALNASAIYLDGASKSSQDSDIVKADIDSQLQKAFEGGKPIAVIHRFEKLPPASTLIFYRYCDHENAAFKKTFLIFTVLLGEEEEIQRTIRLSEVEELVTDHLQKKFLSHGHPTAFDKMDIDKYGGLWSRISHLILPVATEKRVEKTEQC